MTNETEQVSFASAVYADESMSRFDKIDWLTECLTLADEADRGEAQEYLARLNNEGENFGRSGL